MAEYDIVARALSRLGKTAGQLIPLRAQAEESRARMGLAKARTEFDIEQARETRAHRTRVFAVGERQREEAREERKLREPVLKAAGIKALRETERGEQPITSTDLFGGMTDKDIPHIVKLQAKIREGIGVEATVDKTGVILYTKQGKPYKRWQMEQDAEDITQIIRANTGARHLLATWADESHKGHPWHEKAKRILAENDELAIAKLNLQNLHKYPPRRGTSGSVVTMYNNRLKEVNAKIKRLEDIKLAKIKAKAKLPATVKFQYWDTKGKVHTQYISKGDVPAAEKKVRERGGTLQKPAKKKKVTITDYPKAAKAVAQILGQEADEKTVEPTERQISTIKAGLNPMGLDFVQRDLPIRSADKTIWPDPDRKKYWVIEPLEKTEGLEKLSLDEQAKRLGITKPTAPRREKPVTRGIPKIKKPEATPGAPPANLLKEGTNTTFKNGQIWTLEKGVPTYLGKKVSREITR